MGEYIKKGVFGIIITLFIIIILMGIFGPKASIEFASVKIENEKYFNTVLVKNLQYHKYLKNIEFIVDSDIKKELLLINGKTIDNKKIIVLNKLKPRNITTINFVTNKKINQNNFSLIKNGQKIDFNYFNNRNNLDLRFIIIIIICMLVNIFISTYKSKRLDDKEITVPEEIIYSDEIVDLEEDNNFYKRILW